MKVIITISDEEKSADASPPGTDPSQPVQARAEVDGDGDLRGDEIVAVVARAAMNAIVTHSELAPTSLVVTDKHEDGRSHKRNIYKRGGQG